MRSGAGGGCAAARCGRAWPASSGATPAVAMLRRSVEIWTPPATSEAAAPAASVHRRVRSANSECDGTDGGCRRSAPRQKQQHPRNSRGFGYLYEAVSTPCIGPPATTLGSQAMYSFSWLKPGQIFDCYLVPFNQLWLTLQATVTRPAKPPEKVNASKYIRRKQLPAIQRRDSSTAASHSRPSCNTPPDAPHGTDNKYENGATTLSSNFTACPLDITTAESLPKIQCSTRNEPITFNTAPKRIYDLANATQTCDCDKFEYLYNVG